ncbi:hypothetical protein CP985_05645 [Malaciobacter mytili LMG 24559]|uniref:Uncharacterized protein n=1 Tax=Malaciobacter mytili LMG 24559 TaxID=1032238 RepID=A0AAX2AGB0_9BACT|nr:hypothetical protein [Malaciobacter mytili]AXH14367.1 hypothetical protein AMYT_0774 [Malaciobacter mytili LMG 24559]RXK16057.1 hypothetical protein CP985_05645 [Malaciobacter mytili LMG 24559]
MEAVNIEDLKGLFPLSLEAKAITPHLNRAIWDYNHVEFEDEIQQVEVIGSKAFYYLAPLLWVDMQDRVNEYEESLETFKDVKTFQSYWLDRSNSALNKTNNDETDEVSYLCI